MLLIIIFALAWAVQGAISEAWSDTKTAIGTARARTRAAAASKVQQVRKAGGRGAAALTIAWWAGQVFRAVWRGMKWFGTSLKTGWTKGWQRGKQKGRDWIARVEQKRVAANTGACGWCRHGSQVAPTRHDCDCTADGCLCTPAPAAVKVAAGAAVGKCSRCEHPYRSGRVAGCACGNHRCPCHVAGAAQGSKQSPIPAPVK